MVNDDKSVRRCDKNFICRPEIGPKHFDKLKPSPARISARPEKPVPTYNTVNKNSEKHVFCT